MVLNVGRIGLDLNGGGGTFDFFINNSLFRFLSLSGCIGFLSRLERKPHIDFNDDNIIGRVSGVYYCGYGYSRMPFGTFY